MTDTEPVRVAAVIGSVREGNYTSKAVHLLADEFATSYSEVTFDIVDPRRLHLPAPGLDEEGDAQQVRDILNPATAIVLATPEYHGSYSSVIKLVIENLGFPSGLSGKPVAISDTAAHPAAHIWQAIASPMAMARTGFSQPEGPIAGLVMLGCLRQELRIANLSIFGGAWQSKITDRRHLACRWARSTYLGINCRSATSGS